MKPWEKTITTPTINRYDLFEMFTRCIHDLDSWSVLILNRNFFNPRIFCSYKKKRDTFVWCINFVLDQLRQSINATSDRTQSMISIVMVAVLLSIIIGISEVSSVDQKEATKKRNHDAYLRSNKYSPMPRRGETLLTLHDRPSSSFDSDTIIFWVSRGNNSRRRRSIKMRR